MAQPVASSAGAVRFGPFVLNLRSGELYRGDACVKLQEQPFKALRTLLEAPGLLVTRDQLRERLWGNDTFVDFDHGLNVAMAKLRETLGDSSRDPRFIVTVGSHGYRFIAAVERVTEGAVPSPRRRAMQAGDLAATRHSVGREKEQAQLTAALEHVDAGRGLLVCVAGEPGIGKTTLVEDFLSDLESRGRSYQLAKGRCSERLAGSEAYLPFLEALGSLLRSDGWELRSRLRTLAPSWYAQLFPLSKGDASDEALHAYARATTQERLKREIAAFLEDVARLETLVLFFDDLHWADPSTIDLLAYLATKFDHMRLLVVGAYRPSELFLGKHPFIGVKLDMQARATCRELDVEFLSRGDVERYLALEYPGNCFGGEFAGLIHSRTEGSPLFMVDLVRYLRDQKVIARTDVDPTWRLARSVPDLSGVLPESARSMIERKIEQVADGDREVLTAAAAQGYQFDSAAVAQGLSAESVVVEEAVDRLDRIHGLVKRVAEEELPAGALTQRCRFVHVLYQNAVYASLTPSRRVALSAALAHALEALYGERRSAIALQLAFLYEAARDPGAASDYFLLAAQNAQGMFANQEAIELSRRGLALLAKVLETDERARKELGLQATLAFAFMCTVGYAAPETGANMGRARELCQASRDTSLLCPILWGLWAYFLCKGEMKPARETAEDMLRISGSLNDPVQLVGANNAMAMSRLHQGELLASRQHFDEVSKLYDVAQHGLYLQLYRFDPAMHAAGQMVRLLWLLGFPDQARRKIEEALALARTLSSPLSLAFLEIFAAQLYQNLRWPEKTKEHGQACIAICAEHGIQLERAWVECWHGWALAELGETDDGLSLTRSALATQLSIGARVARGYCQAVLAEALLRARRTEEGLQAVEDGLTASKGNGEPFWDADLWRLKGELLNMQDRTAEAESCFRKAIEIARQQSAKSLELRAATSLAHLWRRNGKGREAHQLLSEVYSWFTEGFDTADLRQAASLLEDASRTAAASA